MKPLRLRAAKTVDHHWSANGTTRVITGHAGKSLEHIVRVAHAGRAGVDGPDAQQRRIYHLLHRDVVALLAALGLQQRSLGFDRDGLRGRAYLQRDVFLQDLRRRHGEVGVSRKS